MTKVHTFPLVSSLYSDTRLPLQYPGGGNPNAAKQVELSLLATWISENITGVVTITSHRIDGTTTSIPVTAEMMVGKVLIIGESTGTVSVGSTPGDSDILADEGYDTNGAVYLIDRYLHTGGTLYFSGYTGVLTVKLVLFNFTT